MKRYPQKRSDAGGDVPRTLELNPHPEAKEKIGGKNRRPELTLNRFHHCLDGFTFGVCEDTHHNTPDSGLLYFQSHLSVHAFERAQHWFYRSFVIVLVYRSLLPHISTATQSIAHPRHQSLHITHQEHHSQQAITIPSHSYTHRHTRSQSSACIRRSETLGGKPRIKGRARGVKIIRSYIAPLDPTQKYLALSRVCTYLYQILNQNRWESGSTPSLYIFHSTPTTREQAVSQSVNHIQVFTQKYDLRWVRALTTPISYPLAMLLEN